LRGENIAVIEGQDNQNIVAFAESLFHRLKGQTIGIVGIEKDPRIVVETDPDTPQTKQQYGHKTDPDNGYSMSKQRYGVSFDAIFSDHAGNACQFMGLSALSKMRI